MIVLHFIGDNNIDAKFLYPGGKKLHEDILLTPGTWQGLENCALTVPFLHIRECLGGNVGEFEQK